MDLWDDGDGSDQARAFDGRTGCATPLSSPGLISAHATSASVVAKVRPVDVADGDVCPVRQFEGYPATSASRVLTTAFTSFTGRRAP
jgi:hypothetical protein